MAESVKRLLPTSMRSHGRGDDHVQAENDADVKVIKTWLKECDKNHGHCHHKIANSLKHLLPARLLDVDTGGKRKGLRLVNTQETGLGTLNFFSRVGYITLSHCWGGMVTEEAQTNPDTLEDRLENIPLDSLTKMFQDAIAMTRELGVRYIWIDSLCIIQNSPEDWATESSKLPDIYYNAYVTIAASDASNGTQGFRLRENHKALPVIIETSNDTICIGPAIQDWWDVVAFLPVVDSSLGPSETRAFESNPALYTQRYLLGV
jgi:hypothetical protein